MSRKRPGVYVNIIGRRWLSSVSILSLALLPTGCAATEKTLWKATSSISIWHYLRYETLDQYRLYNPDSSDCQDLELVYSLTNLAVDKDAGSYSYLIKLEDGAGRVSPADFGTTYYIFDSGRTGYEYAPMSSPSIFGSEYIDYKVGTIHAAICAPEGEYRLVLEDQWSGSAYKSEVITIS